MKENNTEEAEKYIEFLKKEIKDLNRTRKCYTFQSEWHKLMYSRTHELEIYQRSVKTLKNI